MSMIEMSGQIINVFEAPKGETKDGKEYGGESRIQVLGDIALQNNEMKKDLVTLKVDNPDLFTDFLGKHVRFPVGAFASGKSVQFFIPKGTKPVPN